MNAAIDRLLTLPISIAARLFWTVLMAEPMATALFGAEVPFEYESVTTRVSA